MDERIVDHKHREGKRELVEGDPLGTEPSLCPKSQAVGFRCPLQRGLEIGILEKGILHCRHHRVLPPRRTEKRLELLVVNQRDTPDVTKILPKLPGIDALPLHIEGDQPLQVPASRGTRSGQSPRCVLKAKQLALDVT